MKKLTYLIVVCLSILSYSCKDNIIESELSPVAAIGDIRKLHTGSDVVITRGNLNGAYQIRGIVVSDVSNGNLPTGIIVVQGFKKKQLRGINVAVTNSSAYLPGDSVVIDIEGSTLTKVDGSLRISGTGSIEKVSSNNPMRKNSVTSYLLDSLPGVYESTLVELAGTVQPAPAPGETYAGDKELNDGVGLVKIHTENGASFASKTVPASATFAGIPFVQSGSSKPMVKIWPRSINDISNASGPIYAGFPEDFELSVKTSFPAADIAFKTGLWTLDNARTGDTGGRDRFNPPGVQCIRFNQNLATSAYLQMNFNVPNGASKVTFTYGMYYTDSGSKIRLEYSVDDGMTWIAAGPDISDADATHKTATYLLDITGNIRFRINKLGLGSISNGRLSIDDFAIFSN